MNGMGGELVDGSGTINPAALNTTGKVYFSSVFLAFVAIDLSTNPALAHLNARMNLPWCFTCYLSFHWPRS
jgi:hypothetical protein